MRTGEAVAVSELGESLSRLRLRSDASLRAMARSLREQGQLTAVLCFQGPSSLEVFDGFKRLHAARTLGWPTLRIERIGADAVAAKLGLWEAHAGAGLSELEQAWLVRSLCRDDGLPQCEVARRMGRHKSWVNRRLMLAECLSDEVEGQVRLGLLSATAARELCRLPRGNQDEVAQVVMDRGLTSRQATKLIDSLLEAAGDDAAWQTRLDEARGAVVAPRHAKQTPGEKLVSDAQAIRNRSVRLHVRLREKPLVELGEEAAALAAETLHVLREALGALCRTIDEVITRSEVDREYLP